MTENLADLLRRIPQVNAVLVTPEARALGERYSPALVARVLREKLEELRRELMAGRGEVPEPGALAEACEARLKALFQTQKPVVINATGILLHTNLGRAPMARRAAEAAKEAALNYCALEFDLKSGERGDRQEHVEALLRELLGAEGALVVNNNAAAVLLMLTACAGGREVLVSRGELVEIGGSFRVPDIMAQSGCTLREVGTTNKTRLSDYEAALGENTAALLKVHSSNYRIVGFTQSAGIAELSGLAGRAGIPVLYDIGSGAMLPLRDMGLADEPGPAEALREGASLVTFSGDKLLGGPQVGIVAGDPALIGKMKRHPLMRALRPGKMSLAALEATLQLLRDPVTARRELPLYAMLSQSEDALRQRAQAIKDALADIRGAEAWVIQTQAQVGGGSTPGQMIPSFGLALRPLRGSVAALCARLRGGETPVIGRVQHDSLVLDMRTLREGETAPLTAALRAALTEGEERHA